MNQPTMIVDTDPGHDDAIALILAHHYANVVGITTVAGNTRIEDTTRNAQRLTQLLEVDTPVHKGSALPLQGGADFATAVHGQDGLGGIELPEPTRDIASDSAIEYLLDMAAPDLWVVAIGPLTNIAHVLARDPEWIRKIAGLSIMGGATHGGNVTASAEFNIYFDPEAADRVFQAGGNVMLSGLNLTHQVQVSAEEARTRCAGVPNTDQNEFVRLNFDRLIRTLAGLTGTDEVAMHDPVAVLAVTHPHLFQFQPREISVELTGTLTRGMTVVDERLRIKDFTPHVNVGYHADVESVKDTIFNGLFTTA
ncbi:MAG: nucleoside hydrolase [Gammaproteobacteria bacterium]|nr:nucleoside hydrolase [Gammaproteobacteria bacterium]